MTTNIITIDSTEEISKTLMTVKLCDMNSSTFGSRLKSFASCQCTEVNQETSRFFYQSNDRFNDFVTSELLKQIRDQIGGPVFLRETESFKKQFISSYTNMVFLANQNLDDECISENIVSLFTFCKSYINENTKKQFSKKNTDGDVVVKILECLGGLLCTMSQGEELNLVCKTLMNDMVLLIDHIDLDIVQVVLYLIALIYEIYEYDDEVQEFDIQYNSNGYKSQEYEDNENEHNFNGPYKSQTELIDLIKSLKRVSAKNISKQRKQELNSIIKYSESTIRLYTCKEEREGILKGRSNCAELKKLAMKPFKINFSESIIAKIDTWSQYTKYTLLKRCYPYGELSNIAHLDCIKNILDYELCDDLPNIEEEKPIYTKPITKPIYTKPQKLLKKGNKRNDIDVKKRRANKFDRYMSDH